MGTLRALAAKVLAAEHEAEQRWNTATDERNKAPVECSMYQARVRIASDWSELSGVLADAQCDYVNGALSGAEVEAIAAACVTRSREVPEHGSA